MINPITSNPTSILSENMNTIIVPMPPKTKDKMKRVDSILIFFDKSSNNNIIKRLERLHDEISFKPKFDFCIINDDINKAVNEIINIIKTQNKGVYNGS